MSTLPDWPDIAQYSVPGGFANGPKHGERGVALIRWGYSQLQEEANYERARADAAMERLRVAVEMLNTLAAQHSGKVGSTALADCMAVMASVSIRTIGPLPKSEAERE